jgi:bifunctional DNA-binding transcriptional regulator/antitoxin component of YhaV-PrlF toxin-antitoxin module
MRVADAIWTATALLHQENPKAEDFEVQQIVSRAVQEKLVGGFRPGLQAHASGHCVANKKPNGGRYRMLYETDRGRRRLLRLGDSSHPDRNGEIRPDKSELPTEYRGLVDWYDDIYSKQSSLPATPFAAAPADVAAPSKLPTEHWSSAFADLDELQAEPSFVGANGTIVLPERLRRAFEIQEGSCLSIYRERDRLIVQPITEAFIRSLRGCCKGEDSLVEAREREHRMEK